MRLFKRAEKFLAYESGINASIIGGTSPDVSGCALY
jgi:hypothetical protein